MVDDSAVVRGLVSRALESDADISIVGTAMHGELALSTLRKQPVDVVVLDVEMPVMDGLTTLRHIQKEFPRTRVIVASGLTQKGAQITIEALALGAAGCIAKPQSRNVSEGIDELMRELVPLVKALASPAEPAAAIGSRRHAAMPSRGRPASKPQMVVIGSSTGGPNALTEVLSALPADFAPPILIVQHMPPMFTPMLAKHLEKDAGRPCREAAHGEPILKNHTYVAPGGYHVTIDKQGDRMVTLLNQEPPEHFCRPSVNPLFRTAAEWYGKSLLAVMLTGMGDDGIEGTRMVADRGGYVIAQDEATSVVWGMPGAVVRESLANDVLPLSQIGRTIQRLCAQETCRV